MVLEAAASPGAVGPSARQRARRGADYHRQLREAVQQEILIRQIHVPRTLPVSRRKAYSLPFTGIELSSPWNNG